MLLDLILDEENADRMILSHMFLFGAPRACVRNGFIYEAAPAPGADPDDLVAQASEILELGWFHPDDLPETIPDMSGELFLRGDATRDGTSVIVTGAMPGDVRPVTD